MAISFGASGAAGRVNHGSAASLDDLHGGQFSGWAWVNRSTNGANQFIMSKDTGAAGWNLFVTNTTAEGQIAFQTQRGTTDGLFITTATSGVGGTNTTAIGTNTFIGFTYDPAATPQARIYIGYRFQLAYEATMSTQTAGAGTTPTDAAASLVVGNYAASFTLPFLGSVSRVGLVDNRLLTIEEFQAIQVQSSLSETNVSGCVLLTEYTNTTTLTDSSGNSNNGTGTSISNETHVPLPTLHNVNNQDLYFSPYNTDSDGASALAANNVKGSSTWARWNNTGGYCKFKVSCAGTSTYVVAEFDTTDLVGLTANLCAAIGISIDKGPWGRLQLVSNTDARMVAQLTTLLSAGDHEIEFCFFSLGHTTDTDRWTTPANSVKIVGVWFETAVLTLETNDLVRPNNVLAFGASTFEGYAALSAGTGVLNHDVTLTAPRLFARALNAEYGIVAYSGSGFKQGIANETASSSNPSFSNSTSANEWYDKYAAGRSRLVSGVFSPTPDWILIQLGYNDSGLADTDVETALEKVQTAAPGVPIYVIDHQLTNIPELQDGINLLADSSNVVLVTPTTIMIPAVVTEASFDGVHANGRGQAMLGAEILAQTSGGDDPQAPGGGGGIFGGSVVS